MADKPKPPIRWMRQSRPAADVKELTKVALRRGATIDQAAEPQIAHWRLAGWCLNPVNKEQNGYGHFRGVGRANPETEPQAKARRPHGAEWEPARTLQMEVRCRRCENCLKARAAEWGERAALEYERAYYLDPKGKPRGSWFGTLTFAPESLFAARARARQRLDATGVNLDAMSLGDRFKQLHREMHPLVNKYLDMLRRGHRKAGHEVISFRYLLTVEPHPGRPDVPHYHLLVHESSPLQPITYRRLKAFWPHGIAEFSIVRTPQGAYYAAKYLAKYKIARVTASANYGNEVDAESATQVLNKLLLEQQHRISQQIPNETKLDPSNTNEIPEYPMDITGDASGED